MSNVESNYTRSLNSAKQQGKLAAAKPQLLLEENATKTAFTPKRSISNPKQATIIHKDVVLKDGIRYVWNDKSKKYISMGKQLKNGGTI